MMAGVLFLLFVAILISAIVSVNAGFAWWLPLAATIVVVAIIVAVLVAIAVLSESRIISRRIKR
jgi:hypothetical protein